MASNAIAQMLDELMGRDRNLAPTEKRSDPKWDDSDVCKYFLVDFCPHELFTNTRADLGLCDKIHDDILRKEYKKSSRCGRLGYEDDFQRYLQTLINDVEKRIRRGHQRLALNSMQNSVNSNPQNQKEDKIHMLTDRINELVQQAEELGCEGKVEEAQGIMKLIDQLNEERTQLQNQTSTQDPYNEPLKAMEVCNVCGALLVVGDAQQRVDEHILGKQHSGYARIRAYVEGKRMKSKEEEEQREARLRAEREEREKEREQEREERRKKDEERRLEREKEREARRERKKRSRSRSKGRRSRSRDRDRKKRSRSRSRRHRSRSRSRDRHHKSARRRRSRSRGKRSDSRERKHRSKSRERSKKSSKDRSESRGKSEDSQRKPPADDQPADTTGPVSEAQSAAEAGEITEHGGRPQADLDGNQSEAAKTGPVAEGGSDADGTGSEMEPGETN